MIELKLKERVIYEDENLISLSKNSGESYHNDAEGRRGFFTYIQDLLSYKIYSVHRLDKETSGAILFAKNMETQKKLQKLFENRKIEKVYIAISRNKPSKKQGQMKGDIIKTRNGSYKLSRKSENPSFTRFKSFKNKDEYFFLLLPKTGRTHQLRVVCKSLGAPILGDSRYGGEPAERMYLHAYRLSFVLDDREYNLLSLPKEDKFIEYRDYFNEEIK